MSLILGKDRDVNDTISRAKKLLNSAGFNLLETNLINPVKGIWSVHLKDSDSKFYTNGKGSTKESALASAYCEFIERLGLGFFFDDYALDGAYSKDNWVFSPDELKTESGKDFKNELLTKELWNFYDPDSVLTFNHLIDSGRCSTDSIISYPFDSDGKKVYFPVEILKNIYASNGLSAGNSEKEALIQGISECIERGVKNYIIRNGLSLPTIPDNYLKENGFYNIKKEIESYGFPVLIKDASIGGRFPVVCAILIDQENGGVLSSFGCHPNPKVAIERTLTELLQGRRLEKLEGLSKLVYTIHEAEDDSNIESHFINSSGVFYIDIIKEDDKEFTLWEFNGDRECELNYLKELLSREEYKIFYRSYDLGGIWVTQSIVPGLSEIYPVEDLEWDNRNRAESLRDFFKSENPNKETLERAIKFLEDGSLDSNQNIMSYLGISIYEDNSLSSLIVDEVEILILLKLKRFKQIKDIIINRLDFDLIDSARIGFWSSLKCYYLEGNVDIKLLYGNNSFKYLNMFLDGVIPRDLFPVLNSDFSYVKSHREVLEVYRKYKKLRG